VIQRNRFGVGTRRQSVEAVDRRDTELIGVRLAAGDVTAIADAYTQLGPLTASYLRRFVPEDDVDDVMQRVFVEVWRAQARYDPTRSLEGWVLGIARKRAIDHVRSRRTTSVLVDEMPNLPAAGIDGRDIAERVVWGMEIRAGLATLSAEQRIVIELAYFGDCTQAEIATRLGIPLGTVKARMARGMRRLAAALRTEEDT
jgi:RNA polymerase sigma factor (sigma-70 family)